MSEQRELEPDLTAFLADETGQGPVIDGKRPIDPADPYEGEFDFTLDDGHSHPMMEGSNPLISQLKFAGIALLIVGGMKGCSWGVSKVLGWESENTPVEEIEKPEQKPDPLQFTSGTKKFI